MTPVPQERHSPMAAAWRRIAVHRSAVHGLGALCALVLAGMAEWGVGGDAAAGPVGRALEATHATLGLSLLAGLAGAFLGAGWAAVAHRLGGRGERALMAAAEGLVTLPMALVPALAGGLVDRGAAVIVAATALAVAPGLAVAAHGAGRGALRPEFVTAAVAAGLPPRRIFWRHALPNAAEPLMLAAWPAWGRALAAESLAGVVGLGVAPPVETWGTLMGQALWQPPGLALLVPAGLLLAALAALAAIGRGLAGPPAGDEGPGGGA